MKNPPKTFLLTRDGNSYILYYKMSIDDFPYFFLYLFRDFLIPIVINKEKKIYHNNSQISRKHLNCAAKSKVKKTYTCTVFLSIFRNCNHLLNQEILEKEKHFQKEKVISFEPKPSSKK